MISSASSEAISLVFPSPGAVPVNPTITSLPTCGADAAALTVRTGWGSGIPPALLWPATDLQAWRAPGCKCDDDAGTFVR